MPRRFYFTLNAPPTDGSAYPYTSGKLYLSTFQGYGGFQAGIQTTNGPIPPFGWGIQVSNVPTAWLTEPLQAVTISNPLTVNLWASETSAAANCTLEIGNARCSKDGNYISDIHHVIYGPELPVGTNAVQTFTAPLSAGPVALNNGDRMALQLFISDATSTTMAVGFNVTCGINGTTANVDGDSWIETVEPLELLGTTKPSSFHTIGRGAGW